jgi:hypothetical protein
LAGDASIKSRKLFEGFTVTPGKRLREVRDFLQEIPNDIAGTLRGDDDGPRRVD